MSEALTEIPGNGIFGRMKTCPKCLINKPLLAFYRDATKKGGHAWECKECIRPYKKKYNAGYYAIKRDEMNLARKERYQKNRSRELQSMKRYRDANKDEINSAEREKHRSNPLANMLSNAKARARRKGIEFSITAGDVVIPEICPALGIPLSVGVGIAADNSPSLDRIDNRYGYVRGNVRVVSFKANTIKNAASIDELKRLVEFYSAAIEAGVA